MPCTMHLSPKTKALESSKRKWNKNQRRWLTPKQGPPFLHWKSSCMNPCPLTYSFTLAEAESNLAIPQGQATKQSSQGQKSPPEKRMNSAGCYVGHQTKTCVGGLVLLRLLPQAMASPFLDYRHCLSRYAHPGIKEATQLLINKVPLCLMARRTLTSLFF